MAAAEVVRWSSVVGEYGVLLTEMGSMENLQTPIKPYPRIKYTCMTASKKYIAMGSSTGGLYIFDRKTLRHLRFISNKDGPILAVCFTQCRSLLGIATSPGIVLVLEVSSRHREKPKFIRRSEEHKNTTVTTLCWDEDEARLFIGDVNGVVSVIHVPAASKLPHSVNKGFPLLHTTGIVAKAQTAIVQLECVGDKLLVSTITKTAVVDLKSLDCVPVGVKLRDGLYGSCFFKEDNSDSLTVYSARPGSRLWEVSTDGQVMATQQYKKLLGTPPAPILGYGHSVEEPIAEEEFPPQSVNFAKLLLLRGRFLVTWHGASLYIMDPILGQLVAWYNMDTVVQDVVCIGEEFYVYDAEDYVKWFALLSVKECVSRLYEIGEIRQCLKVLLDCKHYVIPGSARDLVPVSLVTNLKESLCEDDIEHKEDHIVELEELERDMEPATEETVNLQSYHGNTSLTDSPDTLSVCSDAFNDDMELNVSSPGETTPKNGQEDDSLPHRKLKKQWSADISFEGMLISAAAAAKKFSVERQKGFGKLRRSHSADSPGGGRQANSAGAQSTTDPQHDAVDSLGKGVSDVDAGQQTEGQDIHETIPEEESPLLQKKSGEQSPCHSDDSESRQSGNEGGAVEEEASEKREKREKKKRKKRVVTVDIDSPQLKQGSAVPHGRSASFRGTYSPNEDTEVRNRRLSEPEKLVGSPVQSELPPAIPAMLSKAKGLLKKKLKVPSEDPSPLPSPIPPTEEEIMYIEEEESQKIKCPPEVEELIHSSAKTRNEVKNPLVLFSISSLRQAFQEWIPKLHAALKSCLEMNKNDDGNNTYLDLKYFLDEPAFADVAYLTRMCFDCGVYGIESMKCFEDMSCDVTGSNDKISSSSSLVVHDNVEMTDEKDMKDGSLNLVLPNSLETATEHEIGGFNSSISQEGVDEADQTTQAGESTLHSDESRSLTCTNVQEESFKVKTSDSEAREVLDTTSTDINNFGDEPLTLSPHEVNDEALTNSKTGEFSHEEATRNPSLPQRKQGSFNSATCFELVCLQCKDRTAFCRSPIGDVDKESSEQQENDSIRSKFLAYYFSLLDVKQLRRTLFMSRGDRRRTWRTFMDGLSGLIATNDVIAKYLKEGDPRRALHELHDGMDAYSDILLYHLTRLYEHDRRETMMTCARMFPDVQPWEVMEMCRQNSGLSLEASSEDFVFYVEQLIRWRAEVGNTKEQTIGKICEDMAIAKWWFHCSLIVDSLREGMHCQHCGNPRPGSHTIPWQKADHLQQLIDFLLQKDPKEYKDFMDFCWKHGYWVGLIRLCVQTKRRQDALKLVVSLSDLKLIRDAQPWGRLPKSLDEWRYLLELLLSRDRYGDESRDSPHSCTPLSPTDWTPDLTWSNVINLMLERLGAGHTVNLLQALPRDTPLLTTDFYYSCLLGAVIERRQRTLIHELLKKLDSYLWSQRSGSLAPKLNNFRKEEETCGPKSKEDVKPQLESMEQFRTLEDGASNWGQNIRLADGECLVCSLKLCEQISTSNQGLLLFECGHVFHKHCVPEAACVLCFQQNLTTLGEKVL